MTFEPDIDGEYDEYEPDAYTGLPEAEAEPPTCNDDSE